MNDSSSSSAPVMAASDGGPDSTPHLEQRLEQREPSRRAPRGKRSRALLAVQAAFLVSVMGGCWFLYRHNEPGARLQRGIEAIQAHDFEQVKYCLVGLPKTPRYEPQVSLLRGSLLLADKQFREALVELEFALDNDRTKPTALTLAGMALYELDQFRLAELNLQLALQQDPGQVDAHRWLAAAYYDLGIMDRAMAHFEKVGEMDRADPRPHRIMGLIRMDRGSTAQAIEDYEESLARDPNQPDAQQIRLELAQSQMDLLQYSQALETMAGCVQTVDVLALSAECHYNEGRKQQAVELIKRVLAEVPNHRAALMFQARLAADTGDKQRECTILEQVVKHHPNNFDSRYNLALAYQRMGLVEKSDEQMNEAHRLQDLRRESDQLLQQIQAEPYNAEIRYRQGVIADQLDMKILAKTWYKATLALDPEHFKARVALNE